MLGRQRFFCRDPGSARTQAIYGRILRKNGIDVDPGDLIQADGYAETMFGKLGFGAIEALDLSNYEGAALMWDLNRPVPDEWHESFSFIFDGGLLEHVFNAPQALRNVWDMLEVGGRFVSATPFNGFPGHGFYQFGPELVWSHWKRAMGCKVHTCRAIEANGTYWRSLPDPEVLGRRLDVTQWRRPMPTGRVLMYYEVEKTAATPLGDVALQSDYVAMWQRHEETV